MHQKHAFRTFGTIAALITVLFFSLALAQSSAASEEPVRGIFGTWTGTESVTFQGHLTQQNQAVIVIQSDMSYLTTATSLNENRSGYGNVVWIDKMLRFVPEEGLPMQFYVKRLGAKSMILVGSGNARGMIVTFDMIRKTTCDPFACITPEN